MGETVFHAERIFDGAQWHQNAALLVSAGRVVSIASQSQSAEAVSLDGWIVPGFVDLQVNGGGGLLFNNAPNSATIETICAAHARFGTTSVMVTLITDNPTVTATAIAAIQATETAGLLGLHLEGPHLSQGRKGTHDPALIRPMTETDLAQILQAAQSIPHLICTIAPESVSAAQVQSLVSAGVVVSLGHSDCTAQTALTYADAGATMVTHLFNAMSQLQNRAAGLVGAALLDGRLAAGLIADGYHVSDEVMQITLRAKAGPAPVFLVSDAMATLGSELQSFRLNGRDIFQKDGRLTLADGTLAGADIALIDAVRCLHRIGVPLEQALQMAALAPAKALGITDRGHLQSGARADFLSLTPSISCGGTWIGGVRAA